MSNYKKQQDAARNLRTAEITKDLPEFCREYLKGRLKIMSNTKLSYALQLRAFLTYLIEKGVVKGKCDIREITLDEVCALRKSDIVDFVEYLKIKNGEAHQKKLREMREKGIPITLKDKEPPKECSDTTINHYLATLGAFYKSVCSDYQYPNPMAGLERMKATQNSVIYLTDEERDRYLDTAFNVEPLKNGKLSDKKIRDSIRNVAIIKLFLSTGVRISELVGLDVNDLNFEQHSMKVDRKGGDKQNEVFFSDDAEAALREYLDVRSEYRPDKDEPALFLSNKSGTRITVRGVEAMIEKQTRGTDVNGKKITPHKLRSSFAMHRLENNGRDLKDVQDALHHAHLSSTEHYLAETNKSIQKHNRNL